MIKLSKAGKMPCRSWSLQALTTCPGSKGGDGELVDACKGCYATTGNYRFPNVKAPREHNQEDWQRDSWVDDMVAELDNDRASLPVRPLALSYRHQTMLLLTWQCVAHMIALASVARVAHAGTKIRRLSHILHTVKR